MLPSSQKIFQIMVKLVCAAMIIGFYPLITDKTVKAEIISIEGKVHLRRGTDQEFQPVKPLDPTPPGTAIKTMEGGKAKIFFAPTCIIIMGQNTFLKIIESKARENASEGRISLKLLAGKIRFITALTTPGNYLEILSPTTILQATRTDGVLAIGDQDHAVCLKNSSAILIKNRYSTQHCRINPLQMAILSAKGDVKVEKVEESLVERLLKENTLILATPPQQVIQPGAPPRTPITLYDQVRFPWPVFPPVKQTPNIW